jgi:subtilase family serine protease
MHLEVALNPRHSADLAAFNRQVSDPLSPLYHRFLTERAYEQRFAPSSSEVDQVESYFAGFGAQGFAATPDHLGLSFTVSSAGVTNALGVRLVSFGGSASFPEYTAVGTPTLPSGLRPIVSGVSGLSDWANTGFHVAMARAGGVHPVSPRSPNSFVHDPASGTNWFIGTDYSQAYGVNQLYPPSTQVLNATFPSHEAIATILTSAYNVTSGENLPPWDPSVVNQYFNDTFPAGWPKPVLQGVPITIGNVTPPDPGSLGTQNDSTLNEAENSLDLEMAGSLAPGATITNFYFAESVFATGAAIALGSIADDFATSLSAALSHSYGNATLVAVTNSYGLPDLTDPLWSTELSHAAAIGVSVLAASGDQGNVPDSISAHFQGQWPSWPASAAFNSSGTISVGGVTLTLSGSPNGSYSPDNLTDGYDSSAGVIADQTVWYSDDGVNISGSEGGISTVVAEPNWQLRSAAQPAIVNATVLQGAPRLGRAEPDFSFAANVTIVYVSVFHGEMYFAILEGTSVASPILAGILASSAAVGGHRFGFLDPELYRIASYFSQHPGSGNPFLDVTHGGNFVFFAGPGWDAATGWGGLSVPRLLTADGNPSIRNYTYTGPTPGLPTARPASGKTDIFAFWLVIGIIVSASVIFAVVLETRRPRRTPGTGIIPPGAAGGPFGVHPWLTPPPHGPYGPPRSPPAPPLPSAPPQWSLFLCPFCGRPRPAQAGRCPSCGAF